MVAHKKIVSVVKVYDIHRESSQADFYEGKAGDAAGSPTDNGKSVMLGPEPDVGKIASECKYSGWVQLSTVGGESGHAGPHLSASAHGHFNQNHDLHHHAGGQTKVLRPIGGAYFNNKDRTEGMPGPYDPDFGGVGSHRLARDWRSEEPPKDATYRAPSDLRIDGAFVERDSALLYENGLPVFDAVGTVSYWVKPAYTPQMTGRPRTYFCLDQVFKQKNPGTVVQLMHGQWFFASHDTDALAPSPNEGAPLTYTNGPWVPVSMVSGYSTHESYGGAVGKSSPSLNHQAHADNDKENLLRRNGWIHITYMWDMTKHDVTLLINGVVQPKTRAIKIHPQPYNTAQDFLQSPLRFGEPSTTSVLSGRISRNWSADATMDEIYLWKGDHVADAQELWSRGRYYNPRTGREATFTSRELKLAPSQPRDLAAPAKSGTVGAPQYQTQILGASWTWYPETTGKNGEPFSIDYRTTDTLLSRVNLQMVVNDSLVGEPIRYDVGTPIRNVWINPGEKVNYRLSMNLPDSELDSILLGTPIIDDVTIFYTTGTRFLYYELFGGGL
jgi:hypothetical protein